MIDIAANLISSQFHRDFASVIAHAHSAQVRALLVPGITLATIDEAIVLAEQYQHVYVMVGIHPHHATSVDTHTCAQMAQSITAKKVIAWGEMGLDCHRNFVPLATQITALEAQLSLATNHPTHAHLPILFHERDAHKPFMQTLAPFLSAMKGGFVVHCFTNGKQALSCYLDAGGYIGITGWVCDTARGEQLREIVKYIPLDKLLIETDCPYLLPKNMQNPPRNRRNEPQFLSHIASRIAQCMGVTDEEVIMHSTNNACTLFHLPDEYRI